MKTLRVGLDINGRITLNVNLKDHSHGCDLNMSEIYEICKIEGRIKLAIIFFRTKDCSIQSLELRVIDSTSEGCLPHFGFPMERQRP
jgi:hypothetical protein